MTTEDHSNELSEAARSVLEVESRYYQEIMITGVSGVCPYGQKAGLAKHDSVIHRK